MNRVIKLVGLARGLPTEYDGQFVVEYEPPSMDAFGRYRDDGKLVTSADIDQARRFPDLGAALDFGRQQNGLRPDGLPNRPLTAWHLEFMTADGLPPARDPS